MRLDQIARLARFAPEEKRLFWVLAIGRGRAWTSPELADILYDDRGDGGPVPSRIRGLVFSMRRKMDGIHRCNWSIRTVGGSRGWQLMQAEVRWIS